MKIKSIKSSNIDQIKDISFHAIIGSSGYESRSSFLFGKCEFIAQKRICLGFKKNRKLSREKNDLVFLERNFTIIEVNNNSIDELLNIFNKAFNNKEIEETINVLVDYSSMSTYMYFSLLKYFSDSQLSENVVIYFSYTQANYVSPKFRSPLKHNNPIQRITNIDFTNKKIALIVGLGYEKDKALGMYEYFQNHYDDMYLFYTNNDEFINDVRNNNQELISIIDNNNIIEYELSNISYLVVNLNSLIEYLSNKDYRIVIAPTGPKVFTLISLIISFYNQKVSVYRSSEGDTDFVQDKFADPEKDLIVTEVVFEKD